MKNSWDKRKQAQANECDSCGVVVVLIVIPHRQWYTVLFVFSYVVFTSLFFFFFCIYIAACATHCNLVRLVRGISSCAVRAYASDTIRSSLVISDPDRGSWIVFLFVFIFFRSLSLSLPLRIHRRTIQIWIFDSNRWWMFSSTHNSSTSALILVALLLLSSTILHSIHSFILLEFIHLRGAHDHTHDYYSFPVN